jgi:hypothetical protein
VSRVDFRFLMESMCLGILYVTARQFEADGLASI